MNQEKMLIGTEIQSNNVMVLADLLEQLLTANQAQNTSELSDDEKRKAAYALNLCTVSVSQIIDYNDVNFMEREYEAILNNLNLEEMPKDDALLHILKQLLDVVSFFRIQEGEKKLLEKEYQQKMKNAIWNAVPKIGLIPVGGNPVTTVISLASQVGIGYMNYRKEKAKIGLEQERKEWELQRSAMEQFHGLRRELFDTAWRLADKYNFTDSYRLTERQITQYNRILMDADDLRRYERLTYIKDNFVAYPPFHYYLGSAANSVYQNEEMYDAELRSEYKWYAIESFKQFLGMTENNLLREDQLEASCALEYVDLIDDKEEKKRCLERARKVSGNAYDVLELCAMAYLKIGEYQDAAELFRVLVNEDYNTKVNAQLLSGLYSAKMFSNEKDRNAIEKQYRTLQARVGGELLIPLPKLEGDNCNSAFLKTQKHNLCERYVSALTEFIAEYAHKYENICKMDGNILNEMVNLLGQMVQAVQKIVPDERFFSIPLQTELTSKHDEFKNMLTCGGSGSQRHPKVEFAVIASEPFLRLASEIKKRVEQMDSMYLISTAETELDQFLAENSLQQRNSTIGQILTVKNENPISSVLLASKDAEWSRLSEKIERCIKIVETFSQKRNVLKLDDKKGNVSFYRRNEYSFEEYLAKNRNVIQKYYKTQKTILAIIHEHSWLGQDLILSTGTITLFEGKKRKGTILYTEIEKYYDQGGIKFDKALFKNDSIDMNALKALIKELAAIQEEYSPKQRDDKLKDVIQKIEHTMRTESEPAPIDEHKDALSPTPISPDQSAIMETCRTSSSPERIDMQNALIKTISSVREQMGKNVAQEISHICHDDATPNKTKNPPITTDQNFKQPGILEVDSINEMPGNVVSVFARGEYGPICVGAKYRIHLLHITRDLEPYFINGISKNEYVVTEISCNTDVKYVECGIRVIVDLVKSSS